MPLSFSEMASFLFPYQWFLLFFFVSLLISMGLFYGFRNQHHVCLMAYSSLQSWLFASIPFFFILLLPSPWSLMGITFLAIISKKTFFQLMGIYHRSFFLVICYMGTVLLALCIYGNHLFLYNLVPMLVFALLCLVPILRNAYKNMLQYLSLSLFSFMFLGWGVMHLAWILQKKEGFFLLFYLFVLIEFFDCGNLTLSSLVKGKRFLPQINSHRTTSASLVALVMTLGLAFCLQFALPDPILKEQPYFWLITALLATVGAVLGNLIMDVIRRDLGVRTTGVFVLGKGDFINRMQRMVFTTPLYYYFIHFYAYGASH